MSGNNASSAARRARLAAKRQTIYVPAVADDQVYKYALRSAYIAYLLEPATKAKSRPSDRMNEHLPTQGGTSKPKSHVLHKQNASVSGAFGMLEILRDSSSYKDSKSNKFPKELVRILRDTLQAVFMGKNPKYTDQLVRTTFAAFYNAYIEPKFYRQVKDNRKIEDLVLIFVSTATSELKKRVGEDEWKDLVDQHVALFIRLVQDCMKENNLAASASDLMARLASYEAKVLSEEKEVLAPAAATRPIQESVSDLSFSVQDMPLVRKLGALFKKSDSVLQRDIDYLIIICTEQEALQDLKNYMKYVNTQTLPSLRPIDFSNDFAYQEWKAGESKAISELIVTMLHSNPELAKHEPSEHVSSLLSSRTSEIRRSTSDGSHRLKRKAVASESLAKSPAENAESMPDVSRRISIHEKIDEDNGHHSSFTYIPDDPKAYYKRLVELCLGYERETERIEPEAREDDAESQSLLSTPSLLLLNECAVRWRLHPAARIALLFDVVKQMYDHEDLGILDINEAFTLADDLDYSTWPVADRQLYSKILVGMHDSLLRDLYNILQKAFDPKPLNPRPILEILRQHIYSNRLFQETQPDLTAYTVQLDEGLRARAEEVYSEKRHELYTEPSLEIIHVHDFAARLLADLEKLRSRFKDPILGKVEILNTAVDIFIPLLFKDSERVLVALVKQSEQAKMELPTEDVFAIYRILMDARDLYRQVLRKNLDFDFRSIFIPFVEKWLEATDKATVEWVDRAIDGDKFVTENDQMKQSSSVMDLFQFIGEAIDFLKQLNWPDEVQNGRFVTRLSRVLDKTIGLYCQKMEEGFANEMKTQEENSKAIPSQVREGGWMAKAKAVMVENDKIEPFNFSAHSLIRLNNIQYALVKLDSLQNSINVDRIAGALARAESISPKRRTENENFIFTIKIVQGEDLKPCDVNGLSDPYVVLSDEHGRRIAKTRTIWGNLNPRWDETFEVQTVGPLWLAATIWDRDRMGDHDLCGRCYIKLDPSFFGDFLPRDLWIDLDTQGKLLLRVSMEGEKDDIQFYFGRAFRALKRAEGDMTRKIVDTMTNFTQNCLSGPVIKSLLSKYSSGKLSSWLKRTTITTPAPQVSVVRAGLTDEQIEMAIHPLLDYFDANLRTLDETLSKVSSVIVMGKLWKSVLAMFEDLLLPPLSDKPSKKKQLSEPEVEIIYKWLNFLRTYFHADGEGVPMDVLTSLKYNDIISIRFFYDESTENLIRESDKIAQAAFRQQEKRSSSVLPVSLTEPKSVLKYRSLGTIKQHKAKKRDAKQKEQNDDIILRILRMRPESENYLRERFRQKNRLAATAAAEGVLRGPRR